MIIQRTTTALSSRATFQHMANVQRKLFSTELISTSYEDAIIALNGLQSNASVVKNSTLAINKRQHGEKSISDSHRFLKYADITQEDLKKLSIIHVTGTKGKGSTCAFTESLLRNYGFKTGFYSSPHLIAVRERIRIDGVPISEDIFSHHFWLLYRKFILNRQNETDMPAYFKFLTMLAFQVFLESKVDVAIIEVGVGGQYDCTNVINNPVVCGVSSLGIDHVNVLGNTIEEIAWNKGGIFKTAAPAFTVTQPKEAIDVLLERAAERKTILYQCPDLATYDWQENKIDLGLAGPAQHLNATLALQLVNSWMQIKGFSNRPYTQPPLHSTKYEFPILSPPFVISENTYKGLSECSWPGRSQTLKRDSVTYFLDGAHTAESVKVCCNWFKQNSLKSQGSSVFRILIYNSTGARDPGPLLIPLSSIDFDLVIFCPNIVNNCVSLSSDQKNLNNPEDVQMSRCKTNQQFWSYLMSTKQEQNYMKNHSLEDPFQEFLSSNFSDSNYTSSSVEIPSYVFPCISDTLSWCAKNQDQSIKNINDILIERPTALDDAGEIHILVTGSLHLVGGVLAILDPELKTNSPKSVEPHKKVAQL